MNVSYEWLKAFVPFTESAAQLRELITAHIATVDELVSLREDLAPIVVARVVHEAAHPDSDHLHVTKVDAGTGTLTARAIFDNPDGVLLPGLFVRVRIPTRTVDDALMVPDAALGADQSGRYLLVVGKDDVVEQRNVEIGSAEGTLRVIEKGIKADDRVIVGGMQRAVPGQKVKPVAATAPSAPAPKG